MKRKRHKIRLLNSNHNTFVELQVAGKRMVENNDHVILYLSASQIARAKVMLCGTRTCPCTPCLAGTTGKNTHRGREIRLNFEGVTPTAIRNAMLCQTASRQGEIKRCPYCGEKHPDHCPSPEEIAQRTALVREGWDDTDYNRSFTGPRLVEWIPNLVETEAFQGRVLRKS